MADYTVFDTDVMKVRALMGDTDMDNPMLNDEEISVFVSLNNGNLRESAACALESVAVKIVMKLKKFKSVDIEVDGPAVAAALKQLAQQIRDANMQTDDIELANQLLTEGSINDYVFTQLNNGNTIDFLW